MIYFKSPAPSSLRFPAGKATSKYASFCRLYVLKKKVKLTSWQEISVQTEELCELCTYEMVRLL